MRRIESKSVVRMKIVAAPDPDRQPRIERWHLGRALVAHGDGVLPALQFHDRSFGLSQIEAEVRVRGDRVLYLAEVIDDEFQGRADFIEDGPGKIPAIHREGGQLLPAFASFDPDRSRGFRAGIAGDACLRFRSAGTFTRAVARERPSVISANKFTVLDPTQA